MFYWKAGQQLNHGKYIVNEILGSGGFGVTYKITEVRTERLFALKTLNFEARNRADFDELQIKFINEAIALASCPHPNIVRVYPQVFQEEGLWCMVMEYVSGDDLGWYLEKNGKLDEAKAIVIITKIGKALASIHQKGFLHRDIKPANILLRSSGLEPVLIDFGLAREFIDAKSQSMTNSRTESFAPIEQYQRRGNFGAWTDVYALAATLYVLLTARPPLPAKFRSETEYDLTPPQQYEPQISDRTNQAILKGMEIEPGDRPQTIAEWLELLNPQRKDRAKRQDKNQGQTVSRRNWLKYLGYAFGASVSSSIVKNILDSEKDNRSSEISDLESNRTPEKIESTKKKISDTEYEFDVITVNDRGEETNREQKQAKYFTEDLGNGITIEMVEILGGSFIMGSPENEPKRDDDESPQHDVTVPSFYMGKHEVTQAQWKQVSALPQIERELEPDPSYFKGDNLPVENVSWYDAVEFCKRLSEATGKEYRLPSEAEWEYACRAGTTTPFNFGETITTELVNYDGNYTYANAPKGEDRGKTTPVESFPPNAFGLYDLHGNVYEWCADTYQESYAGAPDDGSAWIVNNNNTYVLRGGSWFVNPHNCCSAYRYRVAPVDVSFGIGFRCSISAETP